MLMIVSESLGKTRTLIEVARELSLNLSYFRSAAALDHLMGGQSRRFVLLTENDISTEMLASLDDAAAHVRFGLIICADPEALRLSNRAELLQRLADFANVEWLSPEHDVDMLSNAARKCRRRMLTLAKDELEEAILRRAGVVGVKNTVGTLNGRVCRQG